ncbi:MAG TPA: MarR family transcriptional regulator [Streptosporangiaceae bacterium]|nr:MarR family transcriptional regulator [Streptosporangiaceae bacterium]
MEQIAAGGPLGELLGQLLRAAGPAEAPAAVPGPQVSPSEARALLELLAARGIAQGDLASLLGLEKSTISRLAAGLERKGWIRRGRDTANQRYVRLHLTPEGRAVAARMWREWQDRQDRILGALSDQERAGLAVGLGGLIRALAAEGLIGELPSDAEHIAAATSAPTSSSHPALRSRPGI